MEERLCLLAVSIGPTQVQRPKICEERLIELQGRVKVVRRKKGEATVRRRASEGSYKGKLEQSYASSG